MLFPCYIRVISLLSTDENPHCPLRLPFRLNLSHTRTVKARRLLWLGLRTLLAVALLLAVGIGAIWWYFNPTHTRTSGIVYTQRHGHDLTFDIIRPARPNGLGVLLMLSGGWRSPKSESFRAFIAAPLLRHGYTVFPVSHLSQPEATVTEIAEDVGRAVRFVRHHSADYGIDSKRMGVVGGSAGGHLSLVLATRGAPGRPDAPDPIDQESGAVQSAAVFYPVTDLLNLGASTENLGDGGPPKSFAKAFGPQSTNLAVWKVIGADLSPIYHITSNTPPILIICGGADTLVPPDQATRFSKRANWGGTWR